MPQWLANFVNLVQTTPPDVIGAYILFFIFPVVIFGVLVWGFLQLWLDRRQGQFAGRIKWHLLHVNVPKDAVQTPKGIENFFLTLHGAKSAVTFKEKWFDGKFQAWYSFEIVSVGGRISFYIRTQAKTRDLVEAALYAQYPEAQVTEVEDYVDMIPTDYPNDTWDMWGSEIRMKAENFKPIKTWVDFEHQGEKDQRLKDPLLGLLEILGSMKEGENYFIQLMIMPPAEQEWQKKGVEFIDKVFGREAPKKKGMMEGVGGWWVNEALNQTVGYALPSGAEEKKQDDFVAFKITPREKEQIEAVNRKISKYGFRAKMRFVYFAKHEVFNKSSISAMSKGLFNQYSYEGLNGLGFWAKATPQDDYPWLEWQLPGRQRELVRRYKKRTMGVGSTPFIMNVEELATLWHFPAADARTPVLTSVQARRAEAPVELAFSESDENLLPDFSAPKSITAGEKATSLPQRKPLAVPGIGHQKPEADTAFSDSVQPPVDTSPKESVDRMPRAGMPAPLPPGLDIAQIEANHEPPTNLPT